MGEKPKTPLTPEEQRKAAIAAEKRSKEYQDAVKANGSESKKMQNVAPSSYNPITADTISNDIYSKTNSRNLMIQDGLGEQAWFDNNNLIVGNPHLREIPTPITFTINISEFDSSTALRSFKNGPSKPIELQLNCSISRINVSMKHIINKTNTRTGFLLTFWGMEPDVITGSGSTGLFMNQFGLTDLMSMTGTVEELGFKDAISSAYKASPKVLSNLQKAARSENLFSVSGYQGNEQGKANRRVANAKLAASELTTLLSGSGNDMFRVAAQDAFVELLALFRNNGLIRYDNPNIMNGEELSLNKEQVAQNVYSEKYGDTTATRNARQNDIMVKGNVDFHYKSNLYQGYFKSLSWILDSENPFQWKFDFVFQVQKTFSQVYYPNATRKTY